MPDSTAQAKADLDRAIEMRSRYNYGYMEYLTTWFMLKVCYCFKDKHFFQRRDKRFKRHADAEKRLAKETDFFKFLKLLRVSNFLAKIKLTKH